VRCSPLGLLIWTLPTQVPLSFHCLYCVEKAGDMVRFRLLEELVGHIDADGGYLSSSLIPVGMDQGAVDFQRVREEVVEDTLNVLFKSMAAGEEDTQKVVEFVTMLIERRVMVGEAANDL